MRIALEDLHLRWILGAFLLPVMHLVVIFMHDKRHWKKKDDLGNRRKKTNQCHVLRTFQTPTLLPSATPVIILGTDSWEMLVMTVHAGYDACTVLCDACTGSKPLPVNNPCLCLPEMFAMM